MKQVIILLLAVGITNISLAQTGIFNAATFETIATSSFPYLLDEPRDLDFHPTSTDTYELWVLNRGTASSGSSVTIISNAGDSTQSGQRKKDAGASHFMCFATGLAFAENGNWANSPGIADANRGSAGPPGFTGPALWSGDLSIFAVFCTPCNGTHLDMLHSSPYAKGIAHEPGTPGIANAGNIFWVFDGSPNADIARYDFGDHHGAGQSNHSGASVRRYKGLGIVGKAIGAFESEIDMPPCHMVIDPNTGWLYACDNTGSNNRVIRLDTETDSKKGNLGAPYFESQSEYAEYDITWEVFIDSGSITSPCGIDVDGTRLYVSDYVTGEIIAYNLNTKAELGRLQTSPGIMGLKVGPGGNLWYVNATDEEVVKVSNIGWPTSVGDTKFRFNTKVDIYPNPTAGNLTLKFNGSPQPAQLTMVDLFGRTVFSTMLYSNINNINLSDELNSGIYIIRISINNRVFHKKITINN